MSEWYKIETIPMVDVQEFAAQHALAMVVCERPEPFGSPMRFYARFDHAEIKGDGVLEGAFGNGATPDLAIADYAKAIELRTLVIDAFSDERREIRVPRLWYRRTA